MTLSRGTLMLAISNLGTAALSFLLAGLIGRTLGDTGLGAYAVALAWVLPLALLAEFGLGTLITRQVAQASADAGDWVRAAVRARQIMGGLGALALIAAAPFLSANSLIAAGIQLSAPLVFIQPLYSTYTAVMRGRGDMRPIPWLNIGMLAVQLPLTAAAFTWILPTGTWETAVLAALAINTLTSAGQLAAAWIIYRRRFFLHPMQHHAVPLAHLLRASWHFGLAAVFAALQMRLGFMLLEPLAGASAAGYLAAGSRFSEAARLLPNAYFGALFPRLSVLAAEPSALRQVFGRAMLALGAYGALAGLALSVSAPLLIAAVFGDAFAPAVPVLGALSAALALSLLRGGQTLYAYALGEEARVNAINAAAVAAQIALSLGWIASAGAVGAAWALAAAELIGLIGLLLVRRCGDMFTAAAHGRPGAHSDPRRQARDRAQRGRSRPR